MIVEVLVSTLNDGLLNININKDFNYLIIHQVSNGKSNFYNDFFEKNLLTNKIRYIQSDSLGLSISRNIALNNSIGDYLWIMDDDVIINDLAYSELLSLIDKYQTASALIVSHSNKKIKYLSDNNDKYLSIISAASVSSIDMVLKKSDLINIRFNESFGLGAKYPSGEEYIFICNVLSEKKKVLKTQRVLSFHPDVSSGHDFYSSPIKLKTKLKMFNQANGVVIGYCFYFLFILKKLPLIYKSGNLSNLFKSLFNY